MPSERDTLYRLIVESAHEGICVADADGRITYLNRRTAEMLGYTPAEILGRHFSDFVLPANHEEMAQVFESLREQDRDHFEVVLLRKNGEEMCALVNASALRDSAGEFVGALGMVVDITVRKRLEHQIALSDRLESVGRLASGVAHDFKNLLTAVLGFADLAEAKLPGDHPAKDDLREVRDAGERAVGLTQQLLAFGRKQVLNPQVVNINDTINALLRIIPGVVSHNVIVSTDLAEDVHLARVDPTYLQQALLNLVVNARDAMPSGGSLRITTSNVDLEDAPINGIYEFDAGTFVKLTVQDTGVGMDDDTVSQVFEPFFTTKARGNGLGLSSVYGFVKQSKGFITVTSSPGKGAIFTLYFPAATTPAAQLDRPKHWQTVRRKP